MAAGHSKFCKVALCLHRALVDRAVLQAESKNGRVDSFFAVEDAFNLAIKLEKVVLSEEHLLVLNLQSFLDTLFQVDDHLISALGLDVLIDVAISADGLQIDTIILFKRIIIVRSVT